MDLQARLEFAIHPVPHALLLWQHCSNRFCLLCYVICCFDGIKPPRGGFNKGASFIPQEGWFCLFKGEVLSPKRGAFIFHLGWSQAQDQHSYAQLSKLNLQGPPYGFASGYVNFREAVLFIHFST